MPKKFHAIKKRKKALKKLSMSYAESYCAESLLAQANSHYYNMTFSDLMEVCPITIITRTIIVHIFTAIELISDNLETMK